MRPFTRPIRPFRNDLGETAEECLDDFVASLAADVKANVAMFDPALIAQHIYYHVPEEDIAHLLAEALRRLVEAAK